MERWQRNFFAVWPGLLAASMGLMGVIPVLPLYLEERFALQGPGEVEAWTALAFGAAPLTAAVCGPFWGALGDRIGRRAMVLRAQLAIAVAMALMPLAPDPYWFTALRVLQGAFAGFVAPAMALVAGDAPADRQGRVIARLQLAMAMGLALGPPAAAEVMGWWGREAVFWMGSGLAVLSAVPVVLWARDDPRARAAAAASTVPTRIRDVLTNRSFLALLVVTFSMRFALHMVEPFTALWVRELGPLDWFVAGGDVGRALDRTTALAFTILAFGQLIATPTWGRLSDRFGPLRCIAAVALALSCTMALTGQVASVQQYLGLRCAASLFMAGLMTLAFASVARRVDPARKALAFGLVQSCMQFGLALGPLAGSAVAPRIGLRGVFAVSAVVLLLVSAGALLLRRIERAATLR